MEQRNSNIWTCEMYMSGTYHASMCIISFNYFPDNYPITHNYSEKNAMIRLSHANIISLWILLSDHEHVHIFELRVLNYTRGKVMALTCNLSPALLYRYIVVSHSIRHKRNNNLLISSCSKWRFRASFVVGYLTIVSF